MKKDDKKFEVKFIGKEESKKLEQKVINKIGEDEDTVSFINGKILELFFYNIAASSVFLAFLFISIIEKHILSIILSTSILLLFIFCAIQNISLIKEIKKAQDAPKK